MHSAEQKLVRASWRFPVPHMRGRAIRPPGLRPPSPHGSQQKDESRPRIPKGQVPVHLLDIPHIPGRELRLPLPPLPIRSDLQ